VRALSLQLKRLCLKTLVWHRREGLNPSLRRHARELGLAAGGGAHAQLWEYLQGLWDRSQTAPGQEFMIKQHSLLI